MRKWLIFGLIVLVLGFATLATTMPMQNTSAPKTNSTGNIKTLSEEIPKVDFIKRGNALKMQLNNRPDIRLIHHNKRDKSHYYAKEVVVDFKMHPSPQALRKITQDIDGVLKDKLDSVYIFKSNTNNTQQLVDYFSKSPNVEFAEPHFIYLQNQVNVNDTYYSGYQWNLPAIGTEEGWALTKGSKNVKIAVVDTGVDLDHPDLSGRLIQGYNALDENAPPNDDNGHGTHVAGIIASDTNNGKGVAGITWYNPIIPVKVMNADGHGGSLDVAKGIRWAVDHGANIINLSLGNYQSSSVMGDAIKYALKKDVVVIAAAGNDGTNQPSYPAAYKGVLGVSAVDSNGTRTHFSNYGNYVDVAAPGVDIASTYANGKYAALSGTSMAAPHVTALAGLIRSINPKLKNSEVQDIITSTTQDNGKNGPDPYYGSGIIDNMNALQTTYLLKYPNGK